MQIIKRIGVIGLGNMGQPIAARLIGAGYRLTVYDVDSKAVAPVVAGNKAVAATSLADLGRQSDVVITVLPDGKAVGHVIAGNPWGSGDHVAAGLAPGAVVIDTTASAPSATRRLGSWLAERQIAMLDAPLSGNRGKLAVAEGALTIMAGGDPAVIDRCMPVFKVLGQKIFNTGPLGNGHAVKAFQNYISASAFISAVEALLTCKRLGIDPRIALDIFNSSPGYSSITQFTLPEQVLTRKFSTGFPIAYMVKDVRAAIELARELGFDLPYGSRCLEMWSEAMDDLGARADYTSFARYLEKKANAAIEPGGGDATHKP